MDKSLNFDTNQFSCQCVHLIYTCYGVFNSNTIVMFQLGEILVKVRTLMLFIKIYIYIYNVVHIYLNI